LLEAIGVGITNQMRSCTQTSHNGREFSARIPNKIFLISE
jgi:hypothetical protein